LTRKCNLETLTTSVTTTRAIQNIECSVLLCLVGVNSLLMNFPKVGGME
jgi:hypothetical protein